MQTEESNVYPLLAQLDERKASDAETEYSEARDKLSALKEQIGQPGFSAALETLKSGIQHHLEDERKATPVRSSGSRREAPDGRAAAENSPSSSAASTWTVTTPLTRRGRARANWRGVFTLVQHVAYRVTSAVALWRSPA